MTGIQVRIPSTTTPPAEWIEVFDNRPPGVGHSVSPQLRGATIYLSAPDDEIEKYVAHAKDLVEATNAHYNENAAPRLRAEHDDAAAKKAEETRRLEDARKRVEGL